jgi:hypothetical protein
VTHADEAYCKDVVARLQSQLATRYGRGATDADPLSLYEAGIATATFFALPDVLARAGTSFQHETMLARLDVLMEDLLRHPTDVSGDGWARQYGYRSAAAASRAFRIRYGVGVGEARRVGQLGRWLAHAVRTSGANGREAEARQRIADFGDVVRPRVLVRGDRALDDLGTAAGPADARHGRPRYPRGRQNTRVRQPTRASPQGPAAEETR